MAITPSQYTTLGDKRHNPTHLSPRADSYLTATVLHGTFCTRTLQICQYPSTIGFDSAVNTTHDAFRKKTVQTTEQNKTHCIYCRASSAGNLDDATRARPNNLDYPRLHSTKTPNEYPTKHSANLIGCINDIIPVPVYPTGYEYEQKQITHKHTLHNTPQTRKIRSMPHSPRRICLKYLLYNRRPDFG